jgi:hypothetical protein
MDQSRPLGGEVLERNIVNVGRLVTVMLHLNELEIAPEK